MMGHSVGLLDQQLRGDESDDESVSSDDVIFVRQEGATAGAAGGGEGTAAKKVHHPHAAGYERTPEAQANVDALLKGLRRLPAGADHRSHMSPTDEATERKDTPCCGCICQ